MKSRRLLHEIFIPIVIVLTSSTFIIAGCSKEEPTVVSPATELFPYSGLYTSCDIVNGDFSQGFSGWQDENEGPGLSCAVQEVVDVDGRSHVLHLDSRACSNYYLWRTQTFSACGILNRTLMWDWKLGEIARPYALAAVWVKFFNSSSELIGVYSVRRDTGDFPQEYDCSHIVSEICGDNPGIAMGCDRIIGTAFNWETHTISFTNEFFNDLECNPIDPEQINSIQVWIESYNNAGAGVDAYFDNFVYTEPTGPTEVAFDIKPGSGPNRLNPNSKGLLQGIIVGTADFDVRDIDISTVLLEGVSPVRTDFRDASRPGEGTDECDSALSGRDGFDDLTCKFRAEDVILALGLGDEPDSASGSGRDRIGEGSHGVAGRDSRVLTITGRLFDGTPFEGRDCVVIMGR